MSEHMFFARRGRIHKFEAIEARIEAIADKHGANFIYIAPSRTWTAANSWFTCSNLGAPFDRETEQAVAADLRAAGLGWLCEDGPKPETYSEMVTRLATERQAQYGKRSTR